MSISAGKFIFMISLLSAVFLVCSDDNATDPEIERLTGTWNAITHSTLYGSISSPDSSSEETFDIDSQFTLILNADGSYSTQTVFLGNINGEEGTWSVSGDQLTINTPQGADTGKFFISGNSLTLEFGETLDNYTTFEVFVYTKQ